MKPVLKRFKRREEEVLEGFEFLHSDEDENSEGSKSDDMGDFIVEDDEDGGRALRDNGV